MTIIARVAGRRIVVSRPDGSEAGRLSVDMLSTLARARSDRTAACFLRPPVLLNEALFSLTTDEVPIVRPRGATEAWVRSRWEMARFAECSRARAADASASFWLEWYRELRRHVADERLPIDLRGRLREAAHRSFVRSQQGRAQPHFPRASLRQPVRVQLPDDLLERARAAAAERGIVPDRPHVAIDARGRPDTLAEGLEYLAAQGYTVAPLGGSPLLDVFMLLTSAFLVCDNSDAQRMAYLTNTPTLAINATDAYAFYPVRTDGVYLLKTAIDLDTGRELQVSELLAEAYYRNRRNCGFRENSSRDILAGLEEMVSGIRDGWHESDGQSRYRAQVVEAGTAAARRVRHVAKWGPVGGFIGDGRLARVQADRAL